jgi:dihydrofolate reductase
MNNRKVILYIAMSLDGYIAKENDDISFLSAVEQEGEDYGYNEFTQFIDTVIMGRKTYDKVLAFGIPFPHADKRTYIITHQDIMPMDNIIFYNKDIRTLISQLKTESGENIFVDGGAEVVNTLMKDDLIDEYIISIVPVFLGKGIPLFQPIRPEVKLKLTGSRPYEKGLVQLHYIRA